MVNISVLKRPECAVERQSHEVLIANERVGNRDQSSPSLSLPDDESVRTSIDGRCS